MRRFIPLYGKALVCSAALGCAAWASLATAAEAAPVRLVPLSAEFTRLLGTAPRIEVLETQAKWAEGPLCLRDGSVIWSDVERNEVRRWSPGGQPTTWLAPSDYQNGHALDREGRVIAASHGKRAIERQEADGHWQVLVDRYQGKRLNSPNDVVVAADGAIWFSDPEFGVRNRAQSYGGTPEQGGEFLYRYDPATRQLARLATPGLKSPNGLAFSPDGSLLYVADSQRAHDFSDPRLAHRILAYRVTGGTLSDERIFAEIEPGVPDGLKVDAHGNVWTATREGVQVFSPTGTLLGKLLVAAKDTGNLALCTQGDKTELYITAAHWVLRLLTQLAAPQPPAP